MGLFGQGPAIPSLPGRQTFARAPILASPLGRNRANQRLNS